jgi:chromosome segregation ATPase
MSIHVLPNHGQKFVFEGDGDELDNGQGKQAYEGSKGRPPRFRNICTKRNERNTSCKITSVIIGEATRIISKRSEPDVNNMKEIQEALKENESKLSKIQNKMEENQNLLENYQQKLDAIESKLEHDKIQAKRKPLRK